VHLLVVNHSVHQFTKLTQDKLHKENTAKVFSSMALS